MVTAHHIMVYSKAKCDLFIEYYNNIDIPEFATKHETWKLNKWVNGQQTDEIETTEVDVPMTKLDSYVKYATDAYNVTTNIIHYACGMVAMGYSHTLRKYCGTDEPPLDIAWKRHKDDIEKTRKYYNKK